MAVVQESGPLVTVLTAGSKPLPLSGPPHSFTCHDGENDYDDNNSNNMQHLAPKAALLRVL